MIEQHRTLLKPGEGIVREDPPLTEHAEYPKHMAHPAFQSGVVGPEIKSPHGFVYNLPGTSIRFPPLLVMNADQEEYAISQGYQSIGKSDPAAFARAMRDMQPTSDPYVPVMYPKWVGGVLVNDAEAEVAALEKQQHVMAGGRPADVVKSLTSDENPMTATERVEGQVAAISAAQEEYASAALKKTPEQLRIEYLESQLEEMRAMMRVLMPAPAPADSPSSEAPVGPAIGAEVNALEARPGALTPGLGEFVTVPETDTDAGHVEFISTEVVDTQPSGYMVRREMTEDEKAEARRAQSEKIKAGLARRKSRTINAADATLEPPPHIG